MNLNFTLEYWEDDGWYVGRIKEIPGVFSQGESLEELESNIQEAYLLMSSSQTTDSPSHSHTKPISLKVA